MKRAAVLAGGPSLEHEVSLQSSRTILAGLRSAGIPARPIWISHDQHWVEGSEQEDFDDVVERLDAAPDPSPTTGPRTADAEPRGAAPRLAPDGPAAPGYPAEARETAADRTRTVSRHPTTPRPPEPPIPPGAHAALASLAEREEVAYLGLHGAFGEDGGVQRVLEARGIPYTGSGPLASAIAMDKELMKVAAAKVGATCARHELLGPGDEDLRHALAVTGLPCVAKPVSGGSSVGVTLVHEKRAFRAAVAAAREADEDNRVLVESLILGREVTCGVLRRDGQAVALPLVEIRPGAGDPFYDYHAKYESDATAYACPGDVSDEVQAEIDRVSLALFDSLELRGVVRVDFIVEDATDRAVFLELNTLPGFTTHSLVPMAAREAGLPLEQLVTLILDDAAPPRGVS